MSDRHLSKEQVEALSVALMDGKRVIHMCGVLGNSRVDRIYRYQSDYRVQFRGHDGPDLLIMFDPQKFFINGEQAFKRELESNDA